MSKERKEKVMKKMISRLLPLIEKDNPSLDMESLRSVIMVTCLVETDDGIIALQYNTDPDHKEKIMDADLIGTVASLFHKTAHESLKAIMDKVTKMWHLKELLNLIKD